MAAPEVIVTVIGQAYEIHEHPRDRKGSRGSDELAQPARPAA
jgi:hypothetical protein